MWPSRRQGRNHVPPSPRTPRGRSPSELIDVLIMVVQTGRQNPLEGFENTGGTPAEPTPTALWSPQNLPDDSDAPRPGLKTAALAFLSLSLLPPFPLPVSVTFIFWWYWGNSSPNCWAISSNLRYHHLKYSPLFYVSLRKTNFCQETFMSQ